MKRRRPSLALLYLIALAGLCFLLPLLIPLDPVRMDPSQRLAAPSFALPFGADRYGRDLLAQILYGGRVSLSLAGVTTLLSLCIGTTVGLYAAFSPKLDKLIMRVIDAMMAIPAILLAIALMTLFSASAGNIILALTLVYTPSVARLARASALPLKRESYMEALWIAGASRSRLIWRHALPNIWQGLFLRSAFIFSEVIISEAALSFLGAGLATRTPSWGHVIAAAKLDMIKAPRLILIPAFFIFSLLFALASLSDGQRAQRVRTWRHQEGAKPAPAPNDSARGPQPREAERGSVCAESDTVLDPTEASRGSACADIETVLQPSEPEQGWTDSESRSRLKRIFLDNISLSYDSPEGRKQILDQIHLALEPGQIVALLGESGSGKSSLARLALSLIDQPEATYAGTVLIAGRRLPIGSVRAQALRGQTIALIPQDPTAALDPLQRIEAACAEVLALKEPQLSRAERRERMAEALRRAEIEPTERLLRAYPHQLSGGQKQRILIALALLQGAKFLIADEPTSALDSRLRQGLILLLKKLCKEEGMGLLFITHELTLLSDFADQILVLEAGRIVSRLGANPQVSEITQPYARALFAAQANPVARPALAPALAPAPAPDAPSTAVETTSAARLGNAPAAPHTARTAAEPLLTVEGLKITYGRQRARFGRQKTVTAISDLSFTLAQGECLALLGASGSGKSSTARALVGLAPQTAGTITWRDQPLSQSSAEERQKIQLIFQHPQSSFDPKQTIRSAFREVATLCGRSVTDRELKRLLAQVKMPESSLDKYPWQFSGGQAQRLALARALLMGGELLILDEALSALDLLIKREIIALLIELQDREKLAYLLITHDPSEAHALAHRILDLDQAREADLQ